MTPETTDWVVEWAMWGWAAILALMVAFEIYTLWWNRARGNGIQRANLTAYVSAYFRAGKRRLKYSAGGAVLIGLFVYFIGHFLDWWR